MSRTGGRRKSSLKTISINKTPVSGAKLKFKWSTSAAHLAETEDNSSIILPTIVPDRRQQRAYTVSSLSTNIHSISQFSMSTQKSSNSTRTAQQCPSPVSVRSERSSIQSSPLSLSYAELHQIRSDSPVKRRRKSRRSVISVSDGKRGSTVDMSRKQSIASDASERRDSIAALNPSQFMMFNSSEKRNSISGLNFGPPTMSRISERRDSTSIVNFNPSVMSTISERRDSTSIFNLNPSVMPKISERRDSTSVNNFNSSILSRKSMATPTAFSVLSTNGNYRLANDHLVRLNSPQIRRLNVSEKYINEAKKLYYNPECKIFTPRLSITQVF